MKAFSVNGLLLAEGLEGDVLLIARDSMISENGGRWEAAAEADRKRNRTSRLAGLLTVSCGQDGAVMVLTMQGGTLTRLDLGGKAWQVDADAVLAAEEGVRFRKGRGRFYPRGLGRLVLAEGEGALWLSTGSRACVRNSVSADSGENLFDAACVAAFSDGLDSTVRLRRGGRASASFAGEGQVLTSASRQAR